MFSFQRYVLFAPWALHIWRFPWVRELYVDKRGPDLETHNFPNLMSRRGRYGCPVSCTLYPSLDISAPSHFKCVPSLLQTRRHSFQTPHTRDKNVD
uniref:Uncharacterized protein n=1 Tax=Anguilla anguilla TaxID=7936 RepID=A0A0E9WVR4_ANGAN